MRSPARALTCMTLAFKCITSKGSKDDKPLPPRCSWNESLRILSGHLIAVCVVTLFLAVLVASHVTLLISMCKDLGTHMNGVVLGDASAALATVARRGLGNLRHLDTNYLWIQEKAAKGDLNFKKVAGVDNGADLFTKTLSWNEIQSHIHKLSSQFVQNEINVNYVGARPNGVNLPRILQEMGLAGDRNLTAWTRTDISSRTRRTTMKGGPLWSDVVARITEDAVNGEILDSELARDRTRSLKHTPLEEEPRDIQTILVFQVSKVRSPSTILQDSVRRGGVRGYGKYSDQNSCDY